MPKLQVPVSAVRTLFDHLHRLRDKQRLMRGLIFNLVVYWISVGALYCLTESNSGDAAIAALVALVMSSFWLPVQVYRAAAFCQSASPMTWALGTLLLGPFGALCLPAVQIVRLFRYFP